VFCYPASILVVELDFLLFIVLSFTMTTRSGCSYGDNQLNPQQQNDLLLDMVQQLGSFSNQLGALTQRVDVLWDQLFDKPESSGEKVKVETEDTEIHQNSATKEEMPH